MPYNVLDAACPSRQVLNLITDKWSVLIIYSLAAGPQRYSQLQKGIRGISKKMLTQTLRQLERDGLVTRHVRDVIPPHVGYQLTPLGQTLTEPLSALCHWAQHHMEAVEIARNRYRAT